MRADQASLRARTDAVIGVATAFLQSRFPDDFAECISVGVNGSCARGDLSPVSDVDYCVVFDCNHPALRIVDLPALMKRVEEQVVSSAGNEEFAHRFSAFWTSLEDLRSGHYRIGRFPPYDRGLFRDSGRHVAGMKVDRGSIHAPSTLEVRRESLTFLLDEVRPRLEKLRFFEELPEMSAERVTRLGPVLVTKLVLMPVRLLYVLLPDSESRLFVSAEAAVEGCARAYSNRPWWSLVEEAVHWRRSFPSEPAELARITQALRSSTLQLYLSCIEEHKVFAVTSGWSAAGGDLEFWAAQLTD